MNKAELIDRVREKTGMPRRLARQAVESFVEAVKRSLKSGKDVHIVGFGTFKVLSRGPRRGRNPRTGELISVPAKKAVKFSPGKDFKERIAAAKAN
ncbi:MAG: HU family DNA-binding protein [Candidatus Hydrogenedentota bacterium]